jgi:hypothetical protein
MASANQNQPGFFDWFKLAMGAVQLLGVLMTFLREQKLLNAGGMAILAATLRAQADDLHKIQDTMAAAGQRFDAAGGMPTDGRFRD